METLTPEAKKARANYTKEYRKKMTLDQKTSRRDYQRKWRQENPDKVKAARIRYWNHQGEKLEAE